MQHAEYLTRFNAWNDSLLSLRSAESCKAWTRRFVRWLDTNDRDITDHRILRDYALHLIERKVRVSSAMPGTSWIRRYLVFLKAEGLPVADQERPQFPKDRDQSLQFVPTEVEMHRWLACVNAVSQPYATVLALLPATGFRDSELIALKANDWRVLEGGRVVFSAASESTKNAKPREVPLLKFGQPFFRRYMLEHRKGIDSPWLFPLPKDKSRHISRKAMEEAARVVRSQAGVERATCHAMRRYFVSHMIAAGMDHAVVAAIIGHSNLATFMKYYLPTGEALASQVAEVGA